MRRPAFHHLEEGRADTKMTPMIDCVFLLLIFFVCAASFQVIEDVLPTELPPSGAVEAAVLPPEIRELGQVVLKLQVAGGQVAVALNNRPFGRADMPQLRANLVELAQVAPEIPVILDIAQEVPVGFVVEVYDICRVAGFETINFAASEAV
jgi:biopolymer transport protein ExbD